MTPINDGGPAFPSEVLVENDVRLPNNPGAFGGGTYPGKVTVAHWTGGMSLRDYFAAHAMAALLNNATKLTVDGSKEAFTAAMVHTLEIIGKASYIAADALIAARGKK